MEPRTYLTPLFKWWWLIVASAVLAGVSSFMVVRQEPDMYRSETTLMVGSPFDLLNPEGTQLGLAQQLAQTYGDVARREGIRESTKEALGLSKLPPYQVVVPERTQLIEISVDHTDPGQAYLVARELANQLIALGPVANTPEEQARQAFINDRLPDLENEIAETEAEIQRLETELGGLVGAREIADTQEEIAANQVKLNSLEANYAALLANTQQEAVNVLTILEEAFVPEQPVGPNKMLTVALAIALGVTLAGGAAYLLEYLDDSVKTPEDVKRFADLPMLTAVANIKDEHPLVTHRHPRAPVSEAFRDLRTSIQFYGGDENLRTILVTSAKPSEGKSFIAANLAIVIAQAGFQTVVVDADLRRPTQHRLFDLRKHHGLSDFLELSVRRQRGRNVEQASAESLDQMLDQMLQPTPQEGLDLLTSGSIAPNPSELLGSVGMQQVLSVLNERYDYIVVDSPPCLDVTDPLVLSRVVDNVLLVTSSGQTHRKDLTQAVSRLQSVNAPLQGIVLNRLPVGSGLDYYYYYAQETGVPQTRPGGLSQEASTMNASPLERIKQIASNGRNSLRGVGTEES